MTPPTFKRPDDDSASVLCIRRHYAAPIHRRVCCSEHSQKDGADTLKGVSARPFDMHSLRRAFPERWGEFLRRHFRSTTEVAAFFDVEYRTARYWWEGKFAPAAPFVLRAVTAFPHAAAFLSEAA